jgi:N4-gp56 family major capsid protein|nr:MAG TPA: major capsid protein [Caudoviricetes sp.]
MNKMINLQLFADPNTNTTTQTGTRQEMSPQMKTFYDKVIIKNAVPNLVHDQFGQKKPIPKNSGKTIEFRRLNPFAKATTPLTEGVTPDGKKLDWATVTATVSQYGDYVTTSDMLDMTAIDNNITEAGRVLGDQAGISLDGVVREILNAGTNVQYGDGSKTSRSAITDTDVMTVAAVKRAVTTLKRMNAKKINGDYVAIIHPDVAYDLMNDTKWEAVATYNPKNLYAGEIGRLYGVRFVETSEAKIFEKAGTSSIDVYSTLFLGADAYGTTSIDGGGLEMIVKPKGSAGSADPLNQRSTVGWKATKTACILTQAFMVRVETASKY